MGCGVMGRLDGQRGSRRTYATISSRADRRQSPPTIWSRYVRHLESRCGMLDPARSANRTGPSGQSTVWQLCQEGYLKREYEEVVTVLNRASRVLLNWGSGDRQKGDQQ